MTFADSMTLAERFVNCGIVPAIVAEIRSLDGLSPADADLDEAVKRVGREIALFFSGLRSIEDLQLQLPNLPNKNYLRLRIVQYVILSRLARLQDPARDGAGAAAAPAGAGLSSYEQQVLELLRTHFHLSNEQLDGFLRVIRNETADAVGN